jgi:hypothetical protein
MRHNRIESGYKLSHGIDAAFKFKVSRVSRGFRVITYANAYIVTGLLKKDFAVPMDKVNYS